MNETKLALMLLTLCISVIGTLSCSCDENFDNFQSDFELSVNNSVFGTVTLSARASSIAYCVYNIKTKWEILRGDGITEVYDLELDRTSIYFFWIYYDDDDATHKFYQDEGILISVDCSYFWESYCEMTMIVFIKDIRYDGAQITAAIRLSQCYNSYNETDPVTINITDSSLEPPTNLTVEVLSEDSVNMSWSPPSTLNGLPILYYTVYITSSQRPVEERNTTDTYIILERPCVPTSYQITAWNEVRQGAAASYDVNYFEPLERDTLKTGQICLSCSFIKRHINDSCGPYTTSGCLVRLESEAPTYTFNFTDKNDDDLVLFDCFSIQESTNVSVTVYEMDSGVLVQSNTGSLENILFSIDFTSTGTPTNLSSTVLTVKVVSLIHSEIESVDGGVCVSCVFSSNSLAEGCTVTLYNDQYSFVFNVSHSSTEDIAILKCFKVPQSGVYSVIVEDRNVLEAVEPIKLPAITINHSQVTPKDNDSSSQQIQNDNNIMMLAIVSAGWGATVLVVGVVMVIIITVCLKRRSKNKNAENTESVRGLGSACASSQYYDDAGISQQTSTVTPVVYDTVKQPHAAATGEDNMYELIELSSEARQEKIKVVSNASYGTVQR